MLLLSLAISGTLLLSVIAAAISGVARRRTGLRNVEVPRQSRLATTFCKMTPHHHTHCCPGHSGTSRTDRKTIRGPGFRLVRPVVWQRISRGRTYRCLSRPYSHCQGAVGFDRSLALQESSASSFHCPWYNYCPAGGLHEPAVVPW